MKEALYYEKLNGGVRCVLCPRRCFIDDGKRGFCRVRENKSGKLYSLVYEKPCSVNVDPIEKKPLFHFIPGHMSYSIGTVGCNLRCSFCQNYSISQVDFEDVVSLDLSVREVVKNAILNSCKSIAYTYTEPFVFFEYALDIARLAKKKGIKNVIVSNGFVNEEPLKELCKYIDGANVDLKGNDEFYRKVCGGYIEPVLNSLKILKEKKVWLEVTNLLVTGYNDGEKEIRDRCKWLMDNLGDVPLHFSRFFPCYKLINIRETPIEVLKRAKKIAEDVGLSFVYVGNVFVEEAENTYCRKCGGLLIERHGFDILQNNIKNGKCKCGERINGIWI